MTNDTSLDKLHKDPFFVLLRAGLWEQDASLASYGAVDYVSLYERAREQAVVGLIAAGLERVTDGQPTAEQMRPFREEVLDLEACNADMNDIAAWLMERLAEENVHAVLMKGPGVAQCYARPQWRAVGDIDLLLDKDNYERGRVLLAPLAQSVGPEGRSTLHQGFEFASWELELHGTIRTRLSSRVDRVLDALCLEILHHGRMRIWRNEGVDIPLPDYDCDSILIFTHFLNHFYRGGVGLRQICDWCRLLWTGRDAIDRSLLGQRLEKMGLMYEWKAFGALAVEVLGLPAEAMPFYAPARVQTRKAERILAFILESGNFGHKRGTGYYKKYPYYIRKIFSMGRRVADLCRHVRIFPRGVLHFFPHILINGLRSALHGE